MAGFQGNNTANQLPLHTFRVSGPQNTSSSNFGNQVPGSIGVSSSVNLGIGSHTLNFGNAVLVGTGQNVPLLPMPQSSSSAAMASQFGRKSTISVILLKLREKFIPGNEPANGRRPRNLTVILCVYGFIACAVAVFGCAAVPTAASQYAAGLIGFTLVGALAIRSAMDEWFWDQQGERKYSRNLGNTVLQTTVAGLIFVCLYIFRWYPLFNSTQLVLDTDVVPAMDFPSFSLLQRMDWSTQANLYSNNTKCYLRWYNGTAARCPVSSQDQGFSLVPENESCNCQGLWSKHIEEPFVISDTAYRLLRFGATSRITSSVPDVLLWAQARFDYNATKAQQDNGWLPQPGLSIALHDPRLSLEQALALNRTRLIDIDASAITSINLAIRLYVSLNGTRTYDYDLSISPRTSLHLMCNTGGNGTEYFYSLCATTLQIRIPSFMRTIVTEQANMDWIKMIIEAGAWYSLAQLVGWLLSGAAFAA